jgi:hypothetical protein
MREAFPVKLLLQLLQAKPEKLAEIERFLHEETLAGVSDNASLHHTATIEDLPGSVSFDAYRRKVKRLLHDLDRLPRGASGAERFEESVGEMIKLCFFRCLANVEAKVRSREGTVIRDWIASNRAARGIWALVREKYDATQVIWECKNYDQLSADDFHQASYYMNSVVGRFVIIVFRGQDLRRSYTRHVERIADDKRGMVLILTENDVRVFLRQALKGNFKEDHIYEVYDRACRAIS